MSEKITTTIGDNEYVPPFEIEPGDDYSLLVDSNGRELNTDDLITALNDLAQLRQENEGLKKYIESVAVYLPTQIRNEGLELAINTTPDEEGKA